MKTVMMSKSGRLRLPVEARRRLALDDETEFEIEVDEATESIILRPASPPDDDDSWAYTPEHLALLAEAHRDSREGRVRRLTESELVRLCE